MDSYALLKLCEGKIRGIAHFIVNPRASKLALHALARRFPEVNVYLFDHRPFLKKVKEELFKIGLIEATCLACKRGMLLKVREFGVPVMGDSLGQVASQTLHNMEFISKGIDVIKPLIGSDKEDIEPYVDDEAVRVVGALDCPFKPKLVLTKPKRSEEVEFIVRKALHASKLLGVWSARKLAEMG